MFYVTDHNYNVRAEYADAKSAVERANRDGLVICQRDEDGRLRLYGADPIVRQILGRVHCCQPAHRAAREVFSRLREGIGQFKAMPRWHRRVALAWVVMIHRENRDLYVRVMNGTF